MQPGLPQGVLLALFALLGLVFGSVLWRCIDLANGRPPQTGGTIGDPVNALRAFRYSLFVGSRDFSNFWNWKTWFAGWMVQSLLRRRSFHCLPDCSIRPSRSNSVDRKCGRGWSVAVAWTIPSITWDRTFGTYPLLVIAPASLVPAVIGRTAIWLAAGAGPTLVTFAIMGFVFGLDLPWPNTLFDRAAGHIDLSQHLLHFVIPGTLAMRQPRARLLVLNFVLIVARAFCGVSVPVAFWPDPVQIVVSFLPITHGLRAIRLLLAEAPAGEILHAASLEAAVAVGWVVLAVLLMDRMANAGRKDGSIEFA